MRYTKIDFGGGSEGSAEWAKKIEERNKTQPCTTCGAEVKAGRLALGYTVCLPCGERAAREARMGWCVAPMHKSNYVLVTDKDDLHGLNNKGGLVK